MEGDLDVAGSRKGHEKSCIYNNLRERYIVVGDRFLTFYVDEDGRMITGLEGGKLLMNLEAIKFMSLDVGINIDGTKLIRKLCEKFPQVELIQK